MQRSNVVRQSALLVELVGPAGAGKTTLARALSQLDAGIQVAADLQLRRREHVPVFIANAPFLLPLFLRRYRSSRWFSWDELKAVVYLRAWPSVLRQQATNSRAILLDHGPVFKLATLRAFGPEDLNTESFEEWWNETFRQWALTLDMVLWLDAPDALLLERINTRSQRHLVKGKPEREAREFLARYRAAYEQVLAKLRPYGRPALLRFDTNQTSLERIVDEVLLSFEEERPQYRSAPGSSGWRAARSA